MTNTYLAFQDGSELLVLRPAQATRTDGLFNTGLNLGFPKPREVMNDSSEVDGVDDLTLLSGERTVTINLKITDLNPDRSKDDFFDQLAGFMSPRRRPWLIVDRPSWDGPRQIQFRGSNIDNQRADKSAAYYEVTLTCNCPRGLFQSITPVTFTMEAPTASPALSLTPGAYRASLEGQRPDVALALTPGASYSSALTLTPGTALNDVTVNNPGNAATPPVLYFYGRSVSAILQNLSGSSLYFAFKQSLTIESGHYVVVDFRNQTALIDSNPSLSVYDQIDWSKTTWWNMFGSENGGVNRLLYDASDNDNNSQLVGMFYPMYR